MGVTPHMSKTSWTLPIPRMERTEEHAANPEPEHADNSPHACEDGRHDDAPSLRSEHDRNHDAQCRVQEGALIGMREAAAVPPPVSRILQEMRKPFHPSYSTAL